jgi:hypothetical protein
VIVVRVELWPFGDSRNLRTIEELTIVNVGRIEGDRCRYEARLDGRLVELEHDRSDGALVLVTRALSALGCRSRSGRRASRMASARHRGASRSSAP